MTNLYRTILEFQVRAVCQFDRNTAHQFARNLVEADGWRLQLEQIKSCEEACEKIRVLLYSEQQQQGMDRLEESLSFIDAEIKQRDDRLLAELEASREGGKNSECLETLRTVDYESDKSRIADRVDCTCE